MPGGSCDMGSSGHFRLLSHVILLPDGFNRVLTPLFNNAQYVWCSIGAGRIGINAAGYQSTTVCCTAAISTSTPERHTVRALTRSIAAFGVATSTVLGSSMALPASAETKIEYVCALQGLGGEYPFKATLSTNVPSSLGEGEEATVNYEGEFTIAADLVTAMRDTLGATAMLGSAKVTMTLGTQTLPVDFTIPETPVPKSGAITIKSKVNAVPLKPAGGGELALTADKLQTTMNFKPAGGPLTLDCKAKPGAKTTLATISVAGDAAPAGAATSGTTSSASPTTTSSATTEASAETSSTPSRTANQAASSANNPPKEGGTNYLLIGGFGLLLSLGGIAALVYMGRKQQAS